MEEFQPNPNITQQGAPVATQSRPTFLTVLCILSFVGVGFVILSSLYNLLSNQVSQSVEILQNSNSPFGSMIEDADAYQSTVFITTIINLIAGLICLAGVLLMWNLKKAGFYLYTAAELIPPVVSLVLSGHAGYGETFSGFFMFTMVFALLVAIAFVIMYAVNLKHLK
jgi:hypothetical protein